MIKYLNKLWTTPLSYWWQRIFTGLKRKQENNLDETTPEWLKITNGPAKGYQLYCNPNLFSGWIQMLNGNYDYFIFNSINDYNSKTIWDIGAHFGYSSIVFSCLVGERGKILAFEPNKTNFIRFKEHIDKNEINNIEIFDIAIFDSVGKVKFTYSDDIENSPSTGSHLSDIMPPRSKELYENLGFNEYEVNTNTIDNLVFEKKYPKPDIIKIDVEGAEYNVLNGANKILELYKIQLLIEVHNVLAMYDVLHFLYSLNYKFKIIDRENATVSRTFLYCWK